MSRQSSVGWSDEELKAAIKSYLWMLDQENKGKNYSKIEVNERLRNEEIPERSKASIEYRMRNISSVLQDLSLPHIEGYSPAKNVGSGIRGRIIRILNNLNFYDSNE